jgi:folate-dependent phosphoribosylglycinamide formyltransferase PurN
MTARLVTRISAAKSRVLFLGHDEQRTDLIAALVERDCEVWHTADRIASTAGYDLVVSFGYRHILSGVVIASSPAPIVNLHISYLPWNRGAHPNFWSFYDGTPSGVSIHLIDEGVDTGPILYQRQVEFGTPRTFSQTYRTLIAEIEALFIAHIEEIVSRRFVAVPQRSRGSHHRVADLPKAFGGWDCDIDAEVARLRQLELSSTACTSNPPAD